AGVYPNPAGFLSGENKDMKFLLNGINSRHTVRIVALFLIAGAFVGQRSLGVLAQSRVASPGKIKKPARPILTKKSSAPFISGKRKARRGSSAERCLSSVQRPTLWSSAEETLIRMRHWK